MNSSNRSASQPEGMRRKPVDQKAGSYKIQRAKNDTAHAKYQNRHPDLHQKKADKIGGGQYKPVGAAFHFCPCVIRLQQIINRQIVDRKENAHTHD